MNINLLGVRRQNPGANEVTSTPHVDLHQAVYQLREFHEQVLPSWVFLECVQGQGDREWMAGPPAEKYPCV